MTQGTINIQAVISKFLFSHRSSVHRITGETPYKRAFGREMKTQFDKMKPSKPTIHRPTESRETFGAGEAVRVRDYRQKNQPWKLAAISNKTGNRMYECATDIGAWRRHVDQIMPAVNNSQNRNIIKTSRPPSNEAHIDVDRQIETSTETKTTTSTNTNESASAMKWIHNKCCGRRILLSRRRRSPTANSTCYQQTYTFDSRSKTAGEANI